MENLSPSASDGLGCSLEEGVFTVTVIAKQPSCVASWCVFCALTVLSWVFFCSESFGSPVILRSACVTLYKLELLIEIEADKYCNHMWLAEERFGTIFFPPIFFLLCHIYFISPFHSLIPSLETPAEAIKRGNEDDLQIIYVSEDREHDRVDASQ